VTTLGIEDGNRLAFVLRAEYLVRRTEISVIAMPSIWRYPWGRRDQRRHFLKHGFYGELDVPIGAVDLFTRSMASIRSRIMSRYVMSSRFPSETLVGHLFILHIARYIETCQ
jgi:hypothetical protein